MRDDWHWIYITSLMLLFWLAMYLSEPYLFAGTTVTDWVIALGALASTGVAAWAAKLLFETLQSNRDSNEISRKQLHSNRAYMRCENFDIDVLGKSLDQEKGIYELRNVSCNWQNAGGSTALNVRLAFAVKKKVDDNLFNRDGIKLFIDDAGLSFQKNQSLEHSDELELPVLPANQKKTQRDIGKPCTIWISAIAMYEDIYGRSYIVESTRRVDYKHPDSPGSMIYFKSKPEGNNNTEKDITELLFREARQ
jgi:hypothetical protein